METFILVDIGNTSTTVACNFGKRQKRIQRLPTNQTSSKTIRQVLGRLLFRRRVDDAIIASVVPGVTTAWVDVLRELCNRAPLLVSPELNLGIQIHYPHPEQLGADRLANLAGAVARFGSPVIVADVGTAVTVDAVNQQGRFNGGIIAPGPAVMLDYLAERTACLPRLSLSTRFPSWGRSTKDAMNLGAAVGYRGLLSGIIAHAYARPGLKNASCLLTGGYATWCARGLTIPCTVDHNLTVDGLAWILQNNRKAGRSLCPKHRMP
ncbi:MAG: hypothetical protein A2269_01245 [Lentisphaerae bacterium RIFOXYA12_FULL_60_10]|nr:MAG: hypothetical protein A2269_01245 [Lentisphaerae bacterium RIFOXYA12_FULL_60_10]